MPQEQEPRKKNQRPKTVRYETHIFLQESQVVQELLMILEMFQLLAMKAISKILGQFPEERESLVRQEMEFLLVEVFEGYRVPVRIGIFLQEECLLLAILQDLKYLHKFLELLYQIP